MTETVTLDEWVAQFPWLKQKSRPLWMAIRWEFKQQQPPMTVRQMFYRMSTSGYVEKTENGYRRVQRCLLEMRRADAIPYSWIADNTRWIRRPTSYGSMSEALENWQRNYRRDIWDYQDSHVEIWLEKDALSGVLYDITGEYGVPMPVTRGYSSETFLYDAADILKAIEKPIYIYHFGDFDPSGRDAARDIADKLRGFGAVFEFIEAAVTERQVIEMQLPTRPTKQTDTRAGAWLASGQESVELDAIPPNILRRMVRSIIEGHIDPVELAYVRKVEAEERARIGEIARHFGTSTKT